MRLSRLKPCQSQRLQGLPIIGVGALILDLKLLQIRARPLRGAPALPRRVRLRVDKLHVADPDKHAADARHHGTLQRRVEHGRIIDDKQVAHPEERLDQDQCDGEEKRGEEWPAASFVPVMAHHPSDPGQAGDENARDEPRVNDAVAESLRSPVRRQHVDDADNDRDRERPRQRPKAPVLGVAQRPFLIERRPRRLIVALCRCQPAANLSEPLAPLLRLREQPAQLLLGAPARLGGLRPPSVCAVAADFLPAAACGDFRSFMTVT